VWKDCSDTYVEWVCQTILVGKMYAEAGFCGGCLVKKELELLSISTLAAALKLTVMSQNPFRSLVFSIASLYISISDFTPIEIVWF
jgi:hypothetical protein